MHLLLHDYANYAFARQLASSLADQGISVTYVFNKNYEGPNSASQIPTESKVNFIPLGDEKTKGTSKSLHKRLISELSYAKQLDAALSNLKVDAILSANSPSIVQNRLARKAYAEDVPFFTWMQDLYGIAAKKILNKKLPVIGGIIGQYFVRLDKESIRLSTGVILITDDFRDFARESGVSEDRIHVIENWAPIDDIPLVPKSNDWSRSQGLSDNFRFVYSGTLAMKHNPALLLELAKSLTHDALKLGGRTAEVLVISSSPGAVWLEQQASKLKLQNLRRLDFQPALSFPSILGSADVLLAVLETDAATFSVPSKVLSYLCASKPILAAISRGNLAARIIHTAGAGQVVEPTNAIEFATKGMSMMKADSKQLQAWAQSGRRYAEQTFDLSRITDRFMHIFELSRSATPRVPPSREVLQ